MIRLSVRRSILKVCFVLAVSCAFCPVTRAKLPLPCPRTSNQKGLWLNRSIEILVRSAYAAYTDEGAQPRHQRVVDNIAGAIERCRLAKDAELSSRYPEFFQYVRLLSMAGTDDHELGFEVSDKEYFTETSSFTTIPDFLLTPDFLQLVSSFENLPRAKAFLRELNQKRSPDAQLIFFSYSSRHLGTPDNPDSYRRLLIIVPADRPRGIPEKWVQFGIADPRKPRTVRNVSVVAVTQDPTDAANVFFKDYYRTYRRNGSISIKGRWELGEGDDPCVTCHKSGVLPIFPVAGTVSADEQKTLEAVNERFRGYGIARFGRYADLKKFGPGLGSPISSQKMSITERFKTRECTACHDANGLGALNWPMDSTLIRSFVTGGQMPLNANLPRLARIQLYNQLANDYFAVDETRPGILQSWLRGNMRSVTANNLETNTP